MKKNVLILLINIACNAMFAQNLSIEKSSLNGIIFFGFEKIDSSDVFYFTDITVVNSKGVSFDLRDSYERAESILRLCGDKNEIISFALKKERVFNQIIESKLFKKFSIFQSGIHYGGEIFEVENSKKNIKIAFRIKGKGIKIGTPCPAIYHPLLKEDNHCAFLSPQRFPIFLFTKISSIRHLNEKDINKYSLKRYSFNEFKVMYCE